MVYMRNKQTGEIKAVVPQGPEFLELKAQVDAGGRSLWEQTGAHHATEVVARAEVGELREQDLGKEDVLPSDVGETGVHPEVAPWTNLTPAEVKSGLTPEKKAEEVAEMFADPDGRTSVLAEAAEKIASESELGTQGAGTDDDLDTLKRDELMAQAASLGVEIPGNATKAEIKTAIREHDAEGATA